MRHAISRTLLIVLTAIACLSAPGRALVPAIELTSAQRKNHIALLKAILASDVEAIRAAIEAGADPNLNVDGRLPMEAAILTGEIAVVRALLDKGADPKLKTDAGKALWDFAYAIGNDPGDPTKPIGDLIKSRAGGDADAADDDKPQVILMPEQAVKCEPTIEPNLSAYKGAEMPIGWKAMTTNNGKIVVLSNGKSGEDAGRLIFLEPEKRPTDDLDDIMDWTDHNLRSYARMIGVKKPNEVEIEIHLSRKVPHEKWERKPVRLQAEFDIWDYPILVGSVYMTGEIDATGEFKGIVCHHGTSEEGRKAYRAYLDMETKAFDDEE